MHLSNNVNYYCYKYIIFLSTSVFVFFYIKIFKIFNQLFISIKMIDNSQVNKLLISSSMNNQINDTTNELNTFSLNNIEPILKSETNYHYLCPKCHIFPFIEFIRSKKYIKYTCRCYNNKEILIKDLFDKNNNYMIINDLSDTNILSFSNINNYDCNCEEFKCKLHNQNFKDFNVKKYKNTS